jgi:hypothetical protein
MPNKNKEIYDWLHFAHSYLCMATLGCEEMMSHKYEEEGHSSVYKYKNNFIFIPTLYNVKHGIEVFTKFLRVTFSEKLRKNDTHHDVHELFKVVKEDLLKNEKKISEVINDELSKRPRDVNLQMAKRDLQNFQTYLNDLEKLVWKYYSCQIIDEQIRTRFTIEDVSNTLFRYPENNVSIKIDYEDMFSSISETKAREIYDDTMKLIDAFNGLGFILDIYKQNEK